MQCCHSIVRRMVAGVLLGTFGALSMPTMALASSTHAVDKAAAALVPQAIRETGHITVAMDTTYAPFEYVSADGKIVGYDVDVSDALAAVLGLQAKQVNAKFASIIPGLKAHKYDMAMSAFSITPSREKVVDFIGPYLVSGSMLEVNKGNPRQLNLGKLALCGHVIGGVTGSTQTDKFLPVLSKECVAAGKPAISIKNFATQNEANLALASKRIEAVFAAYGTVAYQVRQSSGLFEIAPGPKYETAPVGIAMPKGSKLAPAIRAALKVLKEDGSLKKLQEKWF